MLDAKEILVHVWDLYGMDREIGLLNLFVRDARGALVVCDAKDEKSMRDAALWKQEVDAVVSLPNGASLPALLCFNKWDVVEGNKELELKGESALNDLVWHSGFCGHVKTSAKTGFNVREAFRTLLSEVSKRGGAETATGESTVGTRTVVTGGRTDSGPGGNRSSRAPRDGTRRADPAASPAGTCSARN